VRRGFSVITGVSGILDRPPLRTMTVEAAVACVHSAHSMQIVSSASPRHCERSDFVRHSPTSLMQLEERKRKGDGGSNPGSCRSNSLDCFVAFGSSQ
jgi:hypothetical protein